LSSAGARLIVSDVDEAKTRRVVKELEAVSVKTDDIYSADADILAPCALGGIINDLTIPQLKVAIVCGGANNQLLETRHGDALESRGILYAPDYVANGGGVLSGSVRLESGKGAHGGACGLRNRDICIRSCEVGPDSELQSGG